MSDLETVQKENAVLKMNQDGLIAQLEAHKSMINEGLNSSMQLRTSVILLQKQAKELLDKNANLLAANEKLVAENAGLKNPAVMD